MTTALIVGGDQIDGIKQVLASRGISEIRHWSGRKVGDGKKVIPHDTELIVLVTDWISHNFTHKIKQAAAKRGVKIVYTPNGPSALNTRLNHAGLNVTGSSKARAGAPLEADCRLNTRTHLSFLSGVGFNNWLNTSGFHKPLHFTTQLHNA